MAHRKGSGMIQPNMATMLGFITTDAALRADAPKSAVRRRAGELHMVSIDGTLHQRHGGRPRQRLAATPSSIRKARITLRSALRCTK
jgi:hypothetical protein